MKSMGPPRCYFKIKFRCCKARSTGRACSALRTPQSQLTPLPPPQIPRSSPIIPNNSGEGGYGGKRLRAMGETIKSVVCVHFPRGRCDRGEARRFIHLEKEEIKRLNMDTKYPKHGYAASKFGRMQGGYMVDSGASNHISPSSPSKLNAKTVSVRTVGGTVSATKEAFSLPIGDVMGWVIPSSPKVLSCDSVPKIP
eukprot:GHVN01063223.1.p1 GENE.GHVN01063223.1~~GHVN01063223.1.p1  ORF type:complete len:196 (-),score=8.85 GHVN01063223.1:886-1473(-)